MSVRFHIRDYIFITETGNYLQLILRQRISQQQKIEFYRCIQLNQGLEQPINRSLELIQLQNGGGQGHRAVVSSLGLSVAQSHKGVDAGGLSGEIVVRNRQESSNHIHVNEHTVVLSGSWDVVLVHEVGLVQVVPIGISVELVGNSALLLHVGSDVEGISVILLVESHGLVVEVQVAGDSDGSVSVDDDHVLIRTEGQTNNERIDVDGVVVGSATSFITVAESDEGVDLSLLGGLGPGSDDQEGANDVPVDGEVEVFQGRVNASFVDGVSVSQVVPIFGFEEGVNVGSNVEEGDGSVSLSG